MPKGVRRTADQRLAEAEAEELRLAEELKAARELRKTLAAEALARKALDRERENIELGALLRDLIQLDAGIKARVVQEVGSRELSEGQREMLERVLGPVQAPAAKPAPSIPTSISSASNGSSPAPPETQATGPTASHAAA